MKRLNRTARRLEERQFSDYLFHFGKTRTIQDVRGAISKICNLHTEDEF
ncbi:hypothetical protein FACS1894205_6830 [Alphaproteobacteria bacterium]|nr:hypothetical protein FACS1894205_6830 [Alphaproteobacteria bacterium]